MPERCRTALLSSVSTELPLPQSKYLGNQSMRSYSRCFQTRAPRWAGSLRRCPLPNRRERSGRRSASLEHAARTRPPDIYALTSDVLWWYATRQPGGFGLSPPDTFQTDGKHRAARRGSAAAVAGSSSWDASLSAKPLRQRRRTATDAARPLKGGSGRDRRVQRLFCCEANDIRVVSPDLLRREIPAGVAPDKREEMSPPKPVSCRLAAAFTEGEACVHALWRTIPCRFRSFGP